MDKLLQDLQSKYTIVYVNSNDNEDIFRSCISTKEEAESFVKDFGSITKSEWIVKNEVKHPIKSMFHKIWLCQHSKKNKKSDNYRNAYCSAYLNIYIKKITKDTRKKDEFLRKEPPLPAIIKLQPKHSHSIDTPDSLRMRRVSDETKAKFVRYFENGMTVSESRLLHAEIIKASENSDEILADAALNPTPRQVTYLYYSWKQGNLQSYINTFDKSIKEDEALKVQEQEEITDLVPDIFESLDEVLTGTSSQESDSSSDESELVAESVSDEALRVQEQEEITDLVPDIFESLDEVLTGTSSQESDSSSDESELVAESVFIPKVPNAYSISTAIPFIQLLQETTQESTMNNPTLSSSMSNNIVHRVQTSHVSPSNSVLKTKVQSTVQASKRFISSGRNASRCVAKKSITHLQHPSFKAKRETTPIQQLQRNNLLLQKITGTLERIERSLNMFSQSSHPMHHENERLESIAKSMEQSARTFEVFSSSLKEIIENR